MIDTSTIPLTALLELTHQFNSLAIFKRPRDVALYHYCIALEMLTGFIPQDAQAALALSRQSIESSFQAIPGIFTNCIAPSTDELSVNPAIYREAQELVRFAHNYDHLVYSYELADRGQWNVDFDTLSRCIKFTYASAQQDNLDTFLRSRELVASSDKQPTNDQLIAYHEITAAIENDLKGSVLFVDPDAISYKFTPTLFALARRWSSLLLNAQNWGFPDTLALGSVTIGDVRRFWNALAVIVNIHAKAQMTAANHVPSLRPKGSAANRRSRGEWADLIAEIGGISVAAATELLWWYTYDFGVCKKAVLIQPLFEIKPDHVCAVWELIVSNNVRRNFLKLLSVQPQLRQFADLVKAMKEDIALTDLAQLFPIAEFAVERRVALQGLTDADLIVYERQSGFVLVIQHKWLDAPESLNESISNDEQLLDGVGQAIRARDAFRQNPAQLRDKLHLSNSDRIGDVEAVVVSREAENTGFLGQPQVPIVLERAFTKLWERSATLRELWENLNVRPDRAEAAERFHDRFGRIDLAGYSFLVPALEKELKF